MVHIWHIWKDWIYHSHSFRMVNTTLLPRPSGSTEMPHAAKPGWSQASEAMAVRARREQMLEQHATLPLSPQGWASCLASSMHSTKPETKVQKCSGPCSSGHFRPVWKTGWQRDIPAPSSWGMINHNCWMNERTGAWERPWRISRRWSQSGTPWFFGAVAAQAPVKQIWRACRSLQLLQHLRRIRRF